MVELILSCSTAFEIVILNKSVVVVVVVVVNNSVFYQISQAFKMGPLSIVSVKKTVSVLWEMRNVNTFMHSCFVTRLMPRFVFLSPIFLSLIARDELINNYKIKLPFHNFKLYWEIINHKGTVIFDNKCAMSANPF